MGFGTRTYKILVWTLLGWMMFLTQLSILRLYIGFSMGILFVLWIQNRRGLKLSGVSLPLAEGTANSGKHSCRSPLTLGLTSVGSFGTVL